MEKWKKILKVSVIVLICTIIMGNVFGAVDSSIGVFVAEIVLYISIASSLISLLLYLISKNNKEKMSTWVIIICGIIIAIVVSNIISKIIEEIDQKEIDKNRKEYVQKYK